MVNEVRLMYLEARLDRIRCEMKECEARIEELRRIHAEVYETIKHVKRDDELSNQ